MIPLPLVTLIDHNSIMVPGQDSADVPRELPETIKAREKEALVLGEHGLEDVWPSLHRAHVKLSCPFALSIPPKLFATLQRIHLDMFVYLDSSHHIAGHWAFCAAPTPASWLR